MDTDLLEKFVINIAIPLIILALLAFSIIGAIRVYKRGSDNFIGVGLSLGAALGSSVGLILRAATIGVVGC